MQSLQYFRNNQKKAEGKSKEFWAERATELEAWLASDKYKRGEYPQGIDDLILELIEWRAITYTIQHAQTKANPFSEHVFFKQWLIGAIYAKHSLLGKLVGNDPRENSLRNLWWKVNKYIARDGACKKEELKHIEDLFHKTAGKFTNSQSKGMLLRNTVIAHNEKNIRVEWKEIDADIKILVRIWSIIVSWSSFGILSPFRTSEQALSGLECFFNPNEIQELARKRKEYLNICIGWSRTHLHNESPDPGGYFIAKISITSSVAS